MSVKIFPSVLNCDQMHFADSLEAIGSADGVHLDIMDNHFVPNLTWGLPTAAAVVQSTSLPVDAHLMIADPDRWAPDYARAGCRSVCFHIEAATAPIRLAGVLRDLGARPGLALNPATPISAIAEILGRFDLVTVMSVEPGFGGQGFISEVLTKIRQLRCLIDERSWNTEILVDGGVNADTVADVVAAGADILVAGSFVFRAEDPAAAITRLRDIGAMVGRKQIGLGSCNTGCGCSQ